MNHPRSTALRRILSLAIVFLTSLAVRADPNSIALINLTGGITKYDGSTVNIGEIDLNVADCNNPALFGQIALTTNLTLNTSGTVDSHPTEVAGVMVSIDATSLGVATGAKVYSVQVNQSSYDAFRTNTVNAAFWLATAQKTRVINLSMGTSNPGYHPTDGTNYTSRGLDRLVIEQGTIVVKSAGNYGALGANTITEPGGAYNIITVGAVNNAAPGTATNVAGYSSLGYLSDGRSKPDIVAPGGSETVLPTDPAPVDNVVMPISPAGTTQRDAGTSFAAPHVAGVAARLLQYGDKLTNSCPVTDPRVIKAILLNSATKLPGWTQQGTGTNGGVISVTHPLDPNQGAGLLNAGRAFNELAGGRTFPTQTGSNSIDGLVYNNLGWDMSGAQLGLTNTYMFSAQSSGELRLTLDWYRDVDSNYNELGLANLDLMLWSSPNRSLNNMTLKAQSISTNDNVEQLYFTDLPEDYYAFGVYYDSYSGGAPPGSIFYGLAWDFVAVPEPSTLLLAGLGSVVLWKLRRRPSPSG